MADIIGPIDARAMRPSIIIFFVGGAVSNDESDESAPEAFLIFSEPPGNFRNRVFPAEGTSLPSRRTSGSFSAPDAW